MRALVGAIIAAGAFIGLGITALGIGTRYMTERPPALDDTKIDVLHFWQLDRPLQFILVFLTASAVVGLGIAFIGLAYHHHRREREYLWEKERAAAGLQRTTV